MFTHTCSYIHVHPSNQPTRADVDVKQLGLNTPLLLAASAGNETIARLLLERGASIHARNLKQHDAVFMSVVYGHVSKGRYVCMYVCAVCMYDLHFMYICMYVICVVCMYDLQFMYV